MSRKLPTKGFPMRPVSFSGLVGTHALDDRETAMRSAYNAGLADALFEIGEFTRTGTPVSEALLDRIRLKEKFVG